MATRILTFGPYQEVIDGVSRLGSKFYIEEESTPIAIRIYAESAPTNDALIDVFDDGVSIFNNRTVSVTDLTTGEDKTKAVVTAAVLLAGDNSETDEDDFNENKQKMMMNLTSLYSNRL